MPKETGESLGNILIFIFLLLALFAPATFSQQPTPAVSTQTPAASQQTHTVKIEFNRRVHMRDRTELSADRERSERVASGKLDHLKLIFMIHNVIVHHAGFAVASRYEKLIETFCQNRSDIRLQHGAI